MRPVPVGCRPGDAPLRDKRGVVEDSEGVEVGIEARSGVKRPVTTGDPERRGGGSGSRDVEGAGSGATMGGSN